jgi:hypothetical protein
MQHQSQYDDDERYEKMYVPWGEVSKREASLKAAGWFRAFNSGYASVENDIGVDVFFRERPGYTPRKDKTLVCKDCHKSFIFTADEQKFFKDKGFIEPKRCPVCRKKNKG